MDSDAADAGAEVEKGCSGTAEARELHVCVSAKNVSEDFDIRQT